MRIFLVILFPVIFSTVWAQKSPFNNKNIQIDSTGNYSFILSGHFHGDGNNKSHLPVNTLLANLDWINNSEADFIVCLGDLFLNIDKEIENYQTYFFNKLEIPLFNAVGNHDLKDNVYQENFGDTYFSFRLNRDMHIILDTEQDDGDMNTEQLELLESATKEKPDNVFIYSHRTIWKDHYEDLDNLFTENTQSTFETNYSDDVYPLIQKMSEDRKVYWFSGSMGGGPSSFFHYTDNNITYGLSAIRGLSRDALLLVHVKDGKVNFETKSLTSLKVGPFESYDKSYWENTEEESELNLGLMWYRFKLMLSHRYFWYGTSFVICLFAMIWFIRKRRSRLTCLAGRQADEQERK
ncbi:hypothetical protein JYT74_01715 [Crocinitomix catalasitica]|nr:hypothetical protein [Crocinitomix catalasitica]